MSAPSAARQSLKGTYPGRGIRTARRTSGRTRRRIVRRCWKSPSGFVLATTFGRASRRFHHADTTQIADPVHQPHHLQHACRPAPDRSSTGSYATGPVRATDVLGAWTVVGPPTSPWPAVRTGDAPDPGTADRTVSNPGWITSRSTSFFVRC